MRQEEDLYFRVSTGLKNIIGKELISDKYIAIFELVKNSYDARATKVTVEFVEGKEIIISDDGIGMDKDDIVNKWLFVAYSEKKIKNRPDSYRDSIKRGREVAGAKGVGRFSCDRLGGKLSLTSKTKSCREFHHVDIDWSQFELDDSEEFVNMRVPYFSTENNSLKEGTRLVISDLRDEWNRESILTLRRSLMKLINPDTSLGELAFEIEIIANHEKNTDEKDLSRRTPGESFNSDRDIVNGLIKNNISDMLNVKTTSIQVTISPDGKTLTTKLTDRGEFIFEIKERNTEYSVLKNIDISVSYLNRSAKNNFRRQMGIRSVEYGSVFIYKNGFRIYPFGEPDQDFFEVNRRKQQGHSRYLGTREILGKIAIKDDENQFIETSSRAHGFVSTDSFEVLPEFFRRRVLMILEKYVVNIINWGEPLRSGYGRVIQPEDVEKELLTQLIFKRRNTDVISVEYNEELLLRKNMSHEAEKITTVIREFEEVTEKIEDHQLKDKALNLQNRAKMILEQNLELEKSNNEKVQEIEKKVKENKMREKQVFFLEGVSKQKVESLINGFHTIDISTDTVDRAVKRLTKMILSNENDISKLMKQVSAIQRENVKAKKVANMAIKGNQELESTQKATYMDISDFIHEYISLEFTGKSIKYNVVASDGEHKCRFDVASFGIILDNITSNSIKAKAEKIDIQIIESDDYIEVIFMDDGVGIPENIDTKMLFEYGIKANPWKEGFGVGLNHIKSLVIDMQGKVEIDPTYRAGFKLVVKLKR